MPELRQMHMHRLQQSGHAPEAAVTQQKNFELQAANAVLSKVETRDRTFPLPV